MRNLQRVLALVAVVTVALYGCDKSPEVSAVPTFDAKAIAAAADNGNLAPVAELNKACTEEVEKNGRRQSICAIQDEVGRLAKPLSVRF